MTPYLDDGDVRLFLGDCVPVMAGMAAESVDAVVTDPPYGLEFMGKEWDRLDYGLPQESVWKGRRGKGGSNIGTDDSKPASRHHVALGVGKKHAFKRCLSCGKRQFSGSPCECAEPDWSIEYPEGAPSSSIRMQRWHQAWATEALRVLRPGGHLLAFGGSRTFHRLTCAIEDAGFEVRDCLSWLYGSGFPKSLDVSKAIDRRGGNAHLAGEIAVAIRAAREARDWTITQADRHFCGGSTNWTWYEGRKGVCRPPTPADFARIAAEWPELESVATLVAEAERVIVGRSDNGIAGGSGGHAGTDNSYGFEREFDLTAPATPEAAAWQGWGTALKPAWEPIVVARKPLTGTVAANVLAHGVGALNVDGCRVEGVGADEGRTRHGGGVPGNASSYELPDSNGAMPAGRWPANVVLSHTPDCREVGTRKMKTGTAVRRNVRGQPTSGFIGRQPDAEDVTYADPDGTETVAAWECSPECPVRQLDEEVGERRSGSRAAGDYGRLGYQGWDSGPMPAVNGDTGGPSRFFYTAKASSAERDGATHPTVKPLALMRWLVRLVTPPGGLVLDPFAGSGTTLLAARNEGLRAIGIEREAEYCEMAAHRLRQLSLFGEMA